MANKAQAQHASSWATPTTSTPQSTSAQPRPSSRSCDQPSSTPTPQPNTSATNSSPSATKPQPSKFACQDQVANLIRRLCANQYPSPSPLASAPKATKPGKKDSSPLCKDASANSKASTPPPSAASATLTPSNTQRLKPHACLGHPLSLRRSTSPSPWVVRSSRPVVP